MKQTEITCHAELLERIRCLKLEKLSQEEDIKRSFKDLAFDFDLAKLMMGSVSGLEKENNVLLRLVNIVLNMARIFVVGRIRGKRRGLKGFLYLLIADKLSDLLIRCNRVHQTWVST